MAKVARREPSGPGQVGAEMPEKAHSWTGATAADGATGRAAVPGGSGIAEKAHTWTEQRPQTGLQGGRPCQVGAEMPE